MRGLDIACSFHFQPLPSLEKALSRPCFRWTHNYSPQDLPYQSPPFNIPKEQVSLSLESCIELTSLDTNF